MRVARRQWPCTASRRDGNLSTRRPLKGKADGAIELSEDHDAETYRALNAVELEDMVYVLHCFHKKGKTRAETPKKEIDVIEQRLYRGLRRPIPLLWMISCPRLPASRASFLGRSEPTLSQESATIFRPGSEEFLPEIVKRSASYRRLPFIENASNFRRGATPAGGLFRRASYRFRSSRSSRLIPFSSAMPVWKRKRILFAKASRIGLSSPIPNSAQCSFNTCSIMVDSAGMAHFERHRGFSYGESLVDSFASVRSASRSRPALSTKMLRKRRSTGKERRLSSVASCPWTKSRSVGAAGLEPAFPACSLSRLRW